LHAPAVGVSRPGRGRVAPPEFDREEFFAAWRDVFDDAEFRERLDCSDHTVESARAQFEAANERVEDHHPDEVPETHRPDEIPGVFETAERVVDRAVSADTESSRALRDRHEQSPFVHLVAPLAGAITAELDLETEFAPAAVEALEDWLFERLTKTFRHPLFILFKAYQQTEYPAREFADATDSTAIYDEFVAEHRDAEYERIFEAYPLLLKLLGVVADQWLGMVHRLDDRIETDRSALARTFNDGSALGRIADVETLSDDPHGEGEIVLRVAFENDCTVVYKPRSVAGESAFGEVLDWTNARAEIPDLHVPAVFDREEYGWMEFTPHGACDSLKAVARYYERMGGLTALAFVLGSTDLHHDNIVAMGEHPVIVDGETILSPRVGSSNKPISPAMDSLLEDSVLDTVLIPFGKDGDGSSNDLTTNGLSELTDEEHRQKLPNFRHPNTDAMDLGFDKAYRFDGQNLPRLDGEVQEASDFLAELKRGFRAVTDAVLADREAFLAPSGPLSAFEGSDVRYLLRPTGHYASKLRSGVDQSLALESLYTIFVPRDDGDSGDGDSDSGGDDADSGDHDDDSGHDAGDGDLWKLVATEIETLRRLTIPRFTVPATGRELKDGRGTRLGTTVAESPVDHARRRVADLDDHWVETQLRLVELAFTGSTVSDPVSAPSDANADSLARAGSARAVVSTVVELLDDAATRYPDGSLRWAELARSSPEGQFLVREPNPGLYEGYAGVGLFLAAVAAVRDDDQLADRSRRVLESARSAFESAETTANGEAPADLSIGGITGRGSVAYGLLTAGRLLGDDDLVESAKRVASRTTRNEVTADAKLDVMAGSAGELLGQLAVHEATASSTRPARPTRAIESPRARRPTGGSGSRTASAASATPS
jgi:lantibiotic modifying enzyme